MQITMETAGETLEEKVSRMSAELTTQRDGHRCLVHLLCFDAGS